MSLGIPNERDENDNQAKIAIKKQFGFAKGEKVKADPSIQEIINGCVEVGPKYIGHTNKLTLREYVNLLKRLQRSTKFHFERGSRNYYNFMSHFV
jgi:hypothetical protein